MSVLRYFKQFFPNYRKLNLLEIGSRGGINSGPWANYTNYYSLFGFDADAKACYNLKNQDGVILPYFIGENDKEINFYITKKESCSSFLLPNLTLLDHFDFKSDFEIKSKQIIKTTSVNQLLSLGLIPEVDFLKIDAQGAEFDILNNADGLKNILGVELEVYFLQQYVNQITFADLDILIRKKFNLELIDMQFTYWKYKDGVRVGNKKGKLAFGDALYLKSPDTILSEISSHNQTFDVNSYVLNAIQIYSRYGYYDFIARLINLCQNSERFDKNFKLQLNKFLLKLPSLKDFNFIGVSFILLFIKILESLLTPMRRKFYFLGERIGNKSFMNFTYNSRHDIR